MPQFPNSVDYLSPIIWTGVVREAPIPSDFIGSRFFPEQDVAGDRIEWDIIKSESPLAPFVAVDAESPTMEAELMTKAWFEIAFMRVKRRLIESDVRMMRAFGDAPDNSFGGSMRNAALAKIARWAVILSNSIDARLEWLQINSLLGSVVVTPNNQSRIQFSITPPVLTKNANSNGAGYWTDATNADPILDLQTWFADLDLNIAEIIMPRKQIVNLTRMVKYRNNMFTAATNVPTSVTVGQAQQFLQAELGVTVTPYDAKYTTRADVGSSVTITKNRMLPENKIICVPAGALGATFTAPAPQGGWNTGKFSWTVDPEQSGRIDPWFYELGVGYYGIPALQRAEEVLVVQVAA